MGTQIPPNQAHASLWEHGNASRYSSCFKHLTRKLQNITNSCRHVYLKKKNKKNLQTASKAWVKCLSEHKMAGKWRISDECLKHEFSCVWEKRTFVNCDTQNTHTGPGTPFPTWIHTLASTFHSAGRNQGLRQSLADKPLSPRKPPVKKQTMTSSLAVMKKKERKKKKPRSLCNQLEPIMLASRVIRGPVHEISGCCSKW